MRHAGVVDQHGEVFAGAHIGDRLYAGICAEIGGQRTNRDLGELDDEFFKPVGTTAHDHQVLALMAEPPGKGPPDARARPGDERQTRAALTIHAGSFFCNRSFRQPRKPGKNAGTSAAATLES